MGKKLSKAPVYFVIAQVQFNPFLALDNYVAEVQDSFRKAGYPDIESINLPVFDIMIGAPHGQIHQAKQAEIKQHSFFNIERTESFVLSNDRFSFQTTHYDVFEQFSEKFMTGLSRVHEIMGLALLSRTGLRYLDAIVPAENEKLSKYLNPNLLGLSEVLHGQLSHSFFETVYKHEDVSVTARAVTAQSRLAVPPDLQQISLKFIERFSAINSLHTVLDNDGSISQRRPFDKLLIAQQLDQIHNEIDHTFKAIVTPDALESWK